jgi:hypothetical protein
MFNTLAQFEQYFGNLQMMEYWSVKHIENYDFRIILLPLKL